MKVLMFGWEFPPYISGGLGTACLGITKGLADHGADITFVLPKLPAEAEDEHVHLKGANQVKGTEVKERIQSFKEQVDFLEIDSLLAPYQTKEEYTRIAEKIRTMSEKEQLDYEISTDFSGHYGPDMMSEIIRYSVIGGIIAQQTDHDVIHAHDWMTYLAGMQAKQASGKPLCVHVHALEFDRSGKDVNQEVYDIERAGMEAADLVIAVSHYTKRIIMNRYSIPEEKIRVVHNAVSKNKRIERLHITKAVDEKIVLFLGRITFQKGPDYFVEAARKVIDKIPDVRFVMAGTGDMFNKMVERMAALRLGRHFHFTGFLKGEEVEKMYALSDLYVMPSVSEPFGIAPLEAMLYDIPIIVSKQSGVAEILDHAIKVDFWDTTKLADKIIAILSQPSLAEEMIEKNRTQLEEIKWEMAGKKLITIYNELT